MALKRLAIDGYGQVELNNVAFRRDGRIEAQCDLDATSFASIPAENGMLLAVDALNATVGFPTAGTDLPIALNYSAEHIYEDENDGLKDFKISLADGIRPRLGYLAVADKFTTNCISYDSAVDTGWTTDTLFKAATVATTLKVTPLYGGYSANGSIAVSATKPAKGPVLKVIAGTTMPDGQFGIKFQVLSV
jgi:hypothetical protein